ncbi:MAG: hypothetical protein QXP29_07300 [Candidatus Nezhaarchaeales archaeon]
MPAQYVFQPQATEGVYVTYEKMYPFDPQIYTSLTLVDTFYLQPKYSGIYYFLTYFYSNQSAYMAPLTGIPFTIYFIPLTQYYPPGSSNFNYTTTWNFNQSGYNILISVKASFLQNELNCNTVTLGNISNSPPAHASPTNNMSYYYVCAYKYNTQYTLGTWDAFGYIPLGTGQWVGIGIESSSPSPNAVSLRATTVWEVY